MASDQLVNAKDVLLALSQVRRRGPDPLLQELEQREPDLAEYLMEECTALHARISRLACKPRTLRRLSRRIENLALVLVISLQQAQLRLWRQETTGTPLTQLDSDLTDPDSSLSPDEPSGL